MSVLIGLGLLFILSLGLAIAENKQKHKPPAGTGPDEKVIAAARKAAEKERKAAEKAAEKERKAADRLQLLDMDIRHYTEQYEQLERIKPKNTKQEIALQEKQYRIERKIAAAALEIERVQTPE